MKAYHVYTVGMLTTKKNGVSLRWQVRLIIPNAEYPPSFTTVAEMVNAMNGRTDQRVIAVRMNLDSDGEPILYHMESK